MADRSAKVPESDLFPKAHAPALGPCAACAARQLAFCNVLEGSELARLLSIMTELRESAGHTIFFEGDGAGSVYNVTEGVVRVSKMLSDGRRQITGFLYPGDFLGLSHGEEFAYTAETITPTRLCRFDRAKLLHLFDELPKLEKRLLGMASDELAAAQDQILLLGRKTARERVVNFFLNLRKQARRRGETGNPLSIPMSRADIADYLGLTIETVSRTITKLTKDGLIALPTPNRLEILDADRLEDIDAGEDI